jgi:hypothetical protein
MKTRLQALGLLDRAIAAMTDEELDAVVASLDDDHREAVERLASGTTAADIRAAVAHGRINGTMESLAMVLSDHCLADCIEQLGDHADNPSTAQLQEVLPGVAERHGVPITRVMLASTVAGEAPASAIIRDLLKHDDLVKLPPAAPREIVPAATVAADPDPEREALLEKRREAKQRKREEARLRREQSAKDRRRA